MRHTIVLLFVLVSAASAQTQFEVASIKPSGPESVRGSDGGPGHKDATRYSFGQATMPDFICVAWDVRTFQISSPWALDRQAFDLVANVPAGATREQFRVMLQNLLAERFALKVHIESKEFPAYELVVGKGGLKVKEAVPGQPTPRADGSPSVPAGDIGWPEFPPNVARMVAQNSFSGGYGLVRLKAQLQTFSALAGMLETTVDLPIVDKTGLTGKYSFTLEYIRDAPGIAPDSPPPAPALPTALQQLGLQLVAKKLPFDVVVVDSFNKMPSEN